MKVRFEQSYFADRPGNVVVDLEDGSNLKIVPCLAADAVEVMAAIRAEYDGPSEG